MGREEVGGTCFLECTHQWTIDMLKWHYICAKQIRSSWNKNFKTIFTIPVVSRVSLSYLNGTTLKWVSIKKGQQNRSVIDEVFYELINLFNDHGFARTLHFSHILFLFFERTSHFFCVSKGLRKWFSPSNLTSPETRFLANSIIFPKQSHGVHLKNIYQINIYYFPSKL